jgi:hypothetical protein
MKKKLIYILAPLGLLLVVGGTVLFLSINSIVKKGFETVGPMLTKVEMKLGGAQISPLSGSGHLTDIFIGNPEGFKTESAIKVGEVKVVVRPASLLSDTIVVDEVTILGPEITFEGSLSGSNLGKILANLEAISGGAGAKDEPAAKSEKKFAIKQVRIEGGKIRLSVTGFAGNAVPVPLPPVVLNDLGTPDKGVTSAQFATAIMKSLVASTTKVVGEAMATIGKGVQEVGKGAADKADKALQGIKGIFKKDGK